MHVTADKNRSERMYTKQEFLEQVESAWNELSEVLAHCEESQMELPGASGGWSVIDVMAHITWYEREMIGVVEQHALVGSEWWNLLTDERNQHIYEANKDRSLSEIRAQFHQVHADLWTLLQEITNVELKSASKFESMPPDWIPEEVLAGNTYQHYREHAQWLRAWLASFKDGQNE